MFAGAVERGLVFLWVSPLKIKKDIGEVLRKRDVANSCKRIFLEEKEGVVVLTQKPIFGRVVLRFLVLTASSLE